MNETERDKAEVLLLCVFLLLAVALISWAHMATRDVPPASVAPVVSK